MAVPEGHRLAYLQEMGIQAYFPRRPLPGARPSARYADLPSALAAQTSQADEPTGTAEQVLQVLAAVETAPEPAPVRPESVAPPVVRVAEPVQAPVREEAKVESAAGHEAASAQETVKFAFAYIPVNEHLAVISELPWTRSASLSPSCRKLLADILRALGLPVQEPHLNPMIFTWPLFEDVQMQGDSARHTLEGFLARRLKLQPVRYLFIFAEQAAPYLFPVDAEPVRETFFRHPRFEVEVCVTHSLNAMDAVRELKRPVWDLLKPLQGRLNGGA